MDVERSHKAAVCVEVEAGSESVLVHMGRCCLHGCVVCVDVGRCCVCVVWMDMGRCSAENHNFRFHLLLFLPQASSDVEMVIQSSGEGSER